jgi:hypothetical protein
LRNVIISKPYGTAAGGAVIVVPVMRGMPLPLPLPLPLPGVGMGVGVVVMHMGVSMYMRGWYALALAS